jgi:hypothetical protein
VTNALVLFQMNAWVTDEMKQGLAHTSLSNAKQLVVGSIRDQVVLDVTATSLADVSAALVKLAAVSGVKAATVVHVAQDTPHP